jgi:hypothetical protein
MIRITQMAATNPLKVSVIVWPRIMIFFNDSSASSQYPSVGFAINRHRVPILPGRLWPMSGMFNSKTQAYVSTGRFFSLQP